jgi:hypothetical protein
MRGAGARILITELSFMVTATSASAAPADARHIEPRVSEAILFAISQNVIGIVIGVGGSSLRLDDAGVYLHIDPRVSEAFMKAFTGHVIAPVEVQCTSEPAIADFCFEGSQTMTLVALMLALQTVGLVRSACSWRCKRSRWSTLLKHWPRA